MKAMLVFELPEDDEAFADAIRGGRYREAIDEFRDRFRQMRKADAVDVEALWTALHEAIADAETT